MLYGSNLGTAEELATRVADLAEVNGFATRLAPLDDFVGKLPEQGGVLIFCASYNGAPPDNASQFIKWLDSDLPKDAFAKLRYAVFGCGNSDWAATYQSIPRAIDEQLAAHGGRNVYVRDSRTSYLKFVSGDTAGAIRLMQSAVAAGTEARLPAENLAWLYYELGEYEFQAGDVGAAGAGPPRRPAPRAARDGRRARRLGWFGASHFCRCCQVRVHPADHVHQGRQAQAHGHLGRTHR